MLVALQRRVVDLASPPRYFINFNSTLNDSLQIKGIEGSLCNQVRVRNALYFNFNVVGLAIMFAIGTTIITANLLCVPRILFWWRQRFKRDNYPKREWVESHLFRFQKTAFEARGVKLWDAEDEVEVLRTIDPQVKFSVTQAWSVKPQYLVLAYKNTQHLWHDEVPATRDFSSAATGRCGACAEYAP